MMDLPSSSSTTAVSFDGRGLRLDTSEQAQVICEELEGKDVEILILQGNTFGIEAAERVGLELARQPNLREAHFKDLFTSRGREEVPVALGHLLKGINDSGAQLTLLDLSDNAIGPIGAPSVIEFLNSSSAATLEKLYLNNCGLGPEGSSSIAPAISRLKELREFICGRNRLEKLGAANMSKALMELQCMEVLKFNQNGIIVEGIKNIAEALIVHQSTLRELDLSDNTVKAEGAVALAKFIESAEALSDIRLDDSLLENEGFSIICDAFTRCPNKQGMRQAAFEGNELYGQKIVDLIKVTFRDFSPDFELDLLENEFSRIELERLTALTKTELNILVDDINSDQDDDEGDDDENDNDESGQDSGHHQDEKEEGEIDDDSDSGSNGYVNIGTIDSDLREVIQDFVAAVRAQPYDEVQANSTFIQLISTGIRPANDEEEYNGVQVLCEELGLIKSEQTRKKKPLARDAIVYIGKRTNELPGKFRDFFEVVVKNNDELSCGKMLFDQTLMK